MPSPAVGNYENRTDAGRVVDTFNPELGSKIRENPTGNLTVTIEQDEGLNVPSTFSYMYTPLPGRVAALEKQLIDAEDYIKCNFRKH